MQQQPPPAPQQPPGPPAPDWFLPAGCIALLAAGGAVLLGAAAGFIGDVRGGEAVLTFALTTALNPLFFAGMPLSMYWLDRYSKHKPLPGIVPDPAGIAVLLVIAVVAISACLLAK